MLFVRMFNCLLYSVQIISLAIAFFRYVYAFNMPLCWLQATTCFLRRFKIRSHRVLSCRLHQVFVEWGKTSMNIHIRRFSDGLLMEAEDKPVAKVREELGWT